MQKIANENNKFNIKVYEKLIKKFNDIKNLYESSKDINLLNQKLENVNIDKSIIKLLSEDNIKEEVNKKYVELLKNNMKIITLEDKEYPIKIKFSSYNIPFCIIATNDIKINKKNIYIYYDEYFTNFAKNVVYYFAKIANTENWNVVTEYSNIKLKTVEIKAMDIFKDENIYNENCIILPNIIQYYNYMLNVIDLMVIIEARYEEKIVNLVNCFLERGKDIYVVPSNVFRKNSYFSNYLIKQGADIILNKQDLKNILNNIIG